jgi:uncharacterized membrane protein
MSVGPDDASVVPAEGKTAALVYILYLTALIVGITQLIGLVIAYVNKDDAPAWVASHYRWQIRTFWIGWLYGLITVMLCFVVIGWVLIPVVLVWYIVRIVKGLKYLSRGQPYPNPTSWGF